jgi:hypothetical protein
MKGTLGFIMGLSGKMSTQITYTTASDEWVKEHGVMSRRKFRNLSDNLAVALVF